MSLYRRSSSDQLATYRMPLEVFRDVLNAGTFRRGGNGGWYLGVNRLRNIEQRVVPFFERFRCREEAHDFERFREAVALLGEPVMTDPDYLQVLCSVRR